MVCVSRARCLQCSNDYNKISEQERNKKATETTTTTTETYFTNSMYEIFIPVAVRSLSVYHSNEGDRAQSTQARKKDSNIDRLMQREWTKCERGKENERKTLTLQVIIPSPSILQYTNTHASTYKYAYTHSVFGTVSARSKYMCAVLCYAVLCIVSFFVSSVWLCCVHVC